MLQGPYKLKNHRLGWLFKPQRLAKFEYLWIRIYSIVAVLGYWGVFLFILLLSLSFMIEFSQWFCYDLLLPNCPFNVGCFLLGWRFSQPLPFIVLHSGFPEVPAFCSWIVTLQAFWFCVAPLGAWEGHICSSFLVFRDTYFELSQSHFSCAACPEDPEPLATFEFPDPVLLLDF